jgi:ABC-type multidrug transport system fused ATPase/permease subunit
MLRAVSRSWGLLSRRQKIVLSVLGLARIVANLLDIVGIALIGAVGALALGAEVSLALINSFDLAPQELIPVVLLGAGIVFIVKTILSLALARASLLYLAKIETNFSMQMADFIFSGTYSRLRKNSQSEIEWAVLRSTHMAFTSFLGSVMGLVGEASLALLVFAFLFFTDWALAFAVTLYFSIILASFHLYSQHKVSQAGQDAAQGSIEVVQSLKNLTAAFKEIAVLNKTAAFLAVFAKSRGRVARGEATNLYIGAVPRLIVELGLITGAIGFVAFQYLRDDGLASLATFGVFLMGSLRMMSALLPLQRALQFIKYEAPRALAAQDLLWELKESMSTLPEPSPQGLPSNRRNFTSNTEHGMSIDIDGVSFEYDDFEQPTRVLHDITLQIAAGSTVAFIGPSGAGKSTLIDLILGLHEPKTGEILCASHPPARLRKLQPGSISYVPQKPGLVSGTIEENIALGVPAELIDHNALREAIEVAQLQSLILSLPEGVKSLLGKHSDSLSGGQIQRIGLARAIYTRPRLLILDEATSALDAETESAISQSLSKLKGHTTLIIVAHRLSTVQNADVIHVIDQGRVIASGTFKELRKASALVKKYVDLMSFDG